MTVALGGRRSETDYVSAAVALRHCKVRTRRLTLEGNHGPTDALCVAQRAKLPEHQRPKALTVALVHGAFQDASSWWFVMRALKARALPTIVCSIPLRGLARDAEHLGRSLDQLDGPVLLVGHSYGAAVVSVAAATRTDVVGLVFIAGLIPDQGESPAELLACPYPRDPSARRTSKPRLLPAVPLEGAVQVASEERAVTQPVFASVFDQPAPQAAWKDLPTWAILATRDHAIAEDKQSYMAARAGAKTTEVDAGHAIAVTHPAAIVEVITTAHGATSTCGRPAHSELSAATAEV